jgi:Fic family protein
MTYVPLFKITPYLLNLTDEASALRTWIELAPLQLSWLPIMQKESRSRNAHFSTSIEGNQLSLAQVKAADRGEKSGAPLTQAQEVENYLKAMSWIERHAKTTISEATVFELHRLITKDLLPEEKRGRYKFKQNYIVDERGIKRHTPTSPQETPRLTRELLAWLNSPETRKLHCIPVCAIFHHRFVSIHPFADGNGRLARALCTLILYQRDFDLHHIFTLDEFFAGDRKRYYDKLEQARALDDNLTAWIEYVAEGIVQTLKNVKGRIENLQVSADHPVHLSPRQEEALRLLRDNPAMRTNELIEQLHVTRARVNQLLTPLIADGLIAKEGESRATRYKLNIQ